MYSCNSKIISADNDHESMHAIALIIECSLCRLGSLQRHKCSKLAG